MNLKFRAWDKIGKRMYTSPNDNQEVDLILMQYTGLMDKNGKEIYEGDIIENHPGVTWMVDWSNKKAQWRVYGGGNFALCSMGAIKIIGNIYENGELLPIPPNEISDSH